jgi:hypothetical protein
LNKKHLFEIVRQNPKRTQHRRHVLPLNAVVVSNCLSLSLERLFDDFLNALLVRILWIIGGCNLTVVAERKEGGNYAIVDSIGVSAIVRLV